MLLINTGQPEHVIDQDCGERDLLDYLPITVATRCIGNIAARYLEEKSSTGREAVHALNWRNKAENTATCLDVALISGLASYALVKYALEQQQS